MPSHKVYEAGLSPRSMPVLIDDAPSCVCHELPYMTSFPFLHSLLEHSPRNHGAHLLQDFLSFFHYVSGFFALRVVSFLFKVANTFDNIGFVSMCWLEHKVSNTVLGIWGVASRMPRACFEGLLSRIDKVQIVQKLSRRVTRVAGTIGKIADLEVARRLSSMADWREVVLENVFPSVSTSIEARAGKSDTVVEAETGLFKLDDLSFYRVLENASASMAEQGELVARSAERIGEQGLDTEKQTEGCREHQAIVEEDVLVVAVPTPDTAEQDPSIFQHENAAAVEQQDIPRSQTIHIHDQQHQREESQGQAVRSLIPPLGQFEQLPGMDIDSLPSPTYDNATFLKRPIPDRHASKTYAKSSMSTASSVGTKPRICRQSQTEREAHRPAEITATAASRANHHWLRPCSACAKKAAEMKHGEPSHGPIGADNAEEGSSRQEARWVESVYRKTVHWV